jgi:hypothetical protein
MSLQLTWRVLPAEAALAVLVVNGALHGLWTDRWADNDTTMPADQASALPVVIGDWDGTTIDMSDSPYPEAMVRASVVRRYVSRSSGSAVTVFLAWGKTGPLALHTPKECYGGLGYQYPPPTKHVANPPGGRPAEFWVSRFSKEDGPAPEHLRIFWAWNADGSWQAAESPRLAFAGRRALYKLYLIRSLARADEPLASDPAVGFLPLLLGELDKSHFTGP